MRNYSHSHLYRRWYGLSYSFYITIQRAKVKVLLWSIAIHHTICMHNIHKHMHVIYEHKMELKLNFTFLFIYNIFCICYLIFSHSQSVNEVYLARNGKWTNVQDQNLSEFMALLIYIYLCSGRTLFMLHIYIRWMRLHFSIRWTTSKLP